MTSVWNIESLEVNPGNPTGVILPKDLPGNTVVDLVAKPIIITPNWVWFTLTYCWNLLDMIGFNHIHWKPSILLLTSFPGSFARKAWTIFCRMPAAPSMDGGWQHLWTLHVWGGGIQLWRYPFPDHQNDIFPMQEGHAPHCCVSGDHVVNVFSFSKAFGMMGWRIGTWAKVGQRLEGQKGAVGCFHWTPRCFFSACFQPYQY